MSKNKKWIIFGIAIIAVVVGFLAGFGAFKQPSSDMVKLRTIEKELSFPGAVDRTEEDAGQRIDRKGAPHFSRDIRMHYKDQAVVEGIQTKLSEMGWSLVYEDGYDSSKVKVYINEAKKACVYTSIDSRSEDSMPHFISLSLSNADTCSSYFSKNSSNPAQ